jgi:hypothetical protein
MSHRRLRRREPSQSIRDAEHQIRSTDRALRPRATDGIAVTPVLVSDRTAPHLCGIEARVFRALVAQLGIPSARIGRRLLVRASDLAEAIGQRDHVADTEPTRSEILARVAGGRRP